MQAVALIRLSSTEYTTCIDSFFVAALQAIIVADAQGGGSGQRADGAGLNSGTALPPLHDARRQQAATVELSYGRGLGCSGRRAPRRLHLR